MGRECAQRWRITCRNGHYAPSAKEPTRNKTVLRKESPDHHDAEIILQLYDLRRESVMREARAAVYSRFRPQNMEEAVAVLKQDHPLNTALRQVVGDWEKVYGMMKWGMPHRDCALESTG